jgi:hypothetical protein
VKVARFAASSSASNEMNYATIGAPIKASSGPEPRNRSRPLLLAMLSEHERACWSVQQLSHNM